MKCHPDRVAFFMEFILGHNKHFASVTAKRLIEPVSKFSSAMAPNKKTVKRFLIKS